MRLGGYYRDPELNCPPVRDVVAAHVEGRWPLQECSVTLLRMKIISPGRPIEEKKLTDGVVVTAVAPRALF